MPGARSLVQDAAELRLGPRELTAEHLREQMVIAVPLPMLVQRYDKEILPLQSSDYFHRVGRPGHRITERRTESVENGRPSQELPDIARQAAEYLLGEEVDNEPVVAGELADEGPWRGVPAQGERRKVISGGPSLGTFEEKGEVRRAEIDPGDIAHQSRCL